MCQLQPAKQAGTIRIETQSPGTRVLLLAGQPLNEPICNYGPFVLNNEKQLQEAFDDFRAGRNGFEAAPKWKSEIRKLKNKRSTSA